MDFALNERQRKLKEDIAAFVATVDKEKIRLCEEASEFPHDLYREIGKRGWAGIMVPTEFGGLGLGAMEMAIATEEFGLIGFSALTLTLHGERTILKLGTPEQQAKYLPKLASGELLAAIVVSEPDVGSSLKHMKTRAVKNNGHYIINGHKHHITLGAEADVLVVFAMTEKGLSAILVDRDTPGIRSRKLEGVGWRLEPHYELFLEDCRVPESQLLGEEGQGLKVFFATFNITRICNASHLIGVARSALRSSIEYAIQRTVGNNKVADFQGIQWIIAELDTKLEAASLVRFKAAWMEDAGMKHEKETAMTKLLAMDLVDSAANKAFSIVGGYAGYRTTPFERYLRDAKIGQVGGGSAEIMKNNIAREVLREYGYKPPKDRSSD
jgi:alkylation response protein AidB-like acyl-CoA dehydrogenase